MDVVWLGEPACHDPAVVGGKAAHLSLLAAAGFRVPPGFCLTTGVFPPAALCGADATAASAVLSGPILEELARACDTLAQRCGRRHVAVRSSAFDEDSSVASFAGAYDTYLNVAGVEAVAAAVRGCWASARSPRVAAYRRHRNLPDQRAPFAVLVQHLISADVSAVLFSANPVSGSADEIVINASWGLGEAIVSGTVTPDTYVVRKRDLSLVSRQVADKQRMVVPVDAGTRGADVPRLFRKRPVLNDEEVSQMARLALALETTMGGPVDVECAWCDGTLYVLQCRPVTTLGVASIPAPIRQLDQPVQESPSPGGEAPSGPIPAPADFPVVWKHQDDARRFWFVNRMHHAEPIPPLAEPFLRHLYEHGINSGAHAYNWPIHSAARRINTYWYVCITPIALSPEELEAENTRSEQKMNVMLERGSEFWATECLPEIQRYLTDWEAFDLRGATLPTLLAHFEESIARHERIWEIHFLLFPCLVAMNTFEELYCDLFGDRRPVDAYRLLQGLDNKSLETDRALWRLSRKALATPAVRQVLAEHDVRSVIPALAASADGRGFVADLRLFLAEYGRRGARITVSEPSWVEDPTPVIQNLRNYAAQPDRDPDAEMAARALERERLIEEARQRLAGCPRPFLEQFEFYLKAAQAATVLEEDHSFWIDQRAVYELRRVLMECGRRFTDAGALDAPEDVFWLTLEELRATAGGLPGRVRARHGIVRERQAEMEHFRAITPPATLGMNPEGPPPDTPLGRAVIKFFGVPVAQEEANPDVLRGHAASGGTVRGPARVIRSLDEAGKLQPGDVLVAEATMPPWTPLFATVAAVVTDVGGITSHCAVVAREYQIPAVVGTLVATSVIRDGQLLEVDGSAGVVRIVSRP